MKVRQLIITLELFEYDAENFPTPVLPKVLYKAKKVFFDEDVEPAIVATEFLASRTGLEQALPERKE